MIHINEKHAKTYLREITGSKETDISTVFHTDSSSPIFPSLVLNVISNNIKLYLKIYDDSSENNIYWVLETEYENSKVILDAGKGNSFDSSNAIVTFRKYKKYPGVNNF